MLFLSNGFREFELEQKFFHDGTPNMNEIFQDFISSTYIDDRNRIISICWAYDNMGELFTLQCIVDWLRDSFEYKYIDLFLPYIPNARMDRVKNFSDVFTLKTFCNMINAMEFDHVYVRNPHSYVSMALLNHVVERKCHLNDDIKKVSFLIHEEFNEFVETIFLPDEGAVKRYTEFDDIIKYPIVVGMKKREWETGRILSLEIFGDEKNIQGKNILIVDDISSYGGSFFFSAKKLYEHGARNVYLYITHCENVINWKKLHNEGEIRKIYTSSSIYRGGEGDDRGMAEDAGVIQVIDEGMSKCI